MDQITDIPQLGRRFFMLGLKAAAQAHDFKERLIASGDYNGPVVVGGGSVRDAILGNPVKDIDVFLLRSAVTEYTTLASSVIEVLEGEYINQAYIPNYDGWAVDMAYLVKARYHNLIQTAEPGEPDLADTLDERELDIIVLEDDLIHEWMQRRITDYTPDMKITSAIFLNFCLARFDLRINAVGTDGEQFAASQYWLEDAREKRLVVQIERQESTDDKMQRIEKRLNKFMAGKFAGWTAHSEQIDGSITPFKFAEGTPAND